MIGLELSLEQLWGLRRYVLGLGGAQVAVTGFVIGAISAWYGASVEAAILLGGSFALSSTAIAMQLMERSHGLASPIGRIAFSILLFQDLMVVPLLFLAAAFGQAGGETLWLLLALAVAKAVAAVALILASAASRSGRSSASPPSPRAASSFWRRRCCSSSARASSRTRPVCRWRWARF